MRTLQIVALLLVFFVPRPFRAQTVIVDPQQRQKLLAASSTTTIGKELNQVGGLGFRILLGTTRGNGELVLLMQRDLPSTRRFEYLLISTNATGTFRREITDAALQGFRAVPQSFLNKSGEVLLVMERDASPTGPPRRYEYNLLSADKTSTFEQEWIASLALGYTPIASLTRREVMLLMEREAR